MKRKRRTFTPEIKSKIALEAMKGEKTINKIAQLYEVHPN
jgi:transposase